MLLRVIKRKKEEKRSEAKQSKAKLSVKEDGRKGHYQQFGREVMDGVRRLVEVHVDKLVMPYASIR